MTTATHVTPKPRTASNAQFQALRGIKVHEAANIFPMIDPENLQALAEDIAVHGQQEPVWFYEGKLLDGRNRMVACQMAGVEPKRREWEPKSGETPATFVMSRNLHRRHLTASQRATLAVDLEPLISAEREAARAKTTPADPFSHRPAETKIISLAPATTQTRFTDSLAKTSARVGEKVRNGRVREQAASTMQVSSGYVNDAKDLKKVDPDLFEQVKAGSLTLPRAQEQIVAAALDRGDLDSVGLRPGTVRSALSRIEAERAEKNPKPARTKLPKATKVKSSKTSLCITVTFGNEDIAEEYLNRLREDKKVLNLSYETIPNPPRIRRTPR
jgi:hypothetical protein